jgi:hypothetical protein
MLFYPSGMRKSRLWVCCSNAGDWGSCPWSGWSLSEDLSGHSAFLKGIWSAGWKKATGKAKANQHELFEFDWTLTACLFFYITVVYFFLRTFWAVTSTLYILVWIHKVCKRQLTCVPSHVIKGICRRRPICACAHVCPRSFKDSVAQVYGQWAGCHVSAVSAVRVLQVWLGIRLYQAGHQLHKMHLSLSYIYN